MCKLYLNEVKVIDATSLVIVYFQISANRIVLVVFWIVFFIQFKQKMKKNKIINSHCKCVTTPANVYFSEQFALILSNMLCMYFTLKWFILHKEILWLEKFLLLLYGYLVAVVVVLYDTLRTSRWLLLCPMLRLFFNVQCHTVSHYSYNCEHVVLYRVPVPMSTRVDCYTIGPTSNCESVTPVNK